MPAFTTTVGFVEQPELGNKGLVITVNKDGEIVGHLMVGKASLHWFKKSGKKKANKTTWDDLIGWFQQRPTVDTSRP